MQLPITTPIHEARAAKYRSLTHPYALPQEQWMMDNVLRDMVGGGIATVIVAVPGYRNPKNTDYEVWRTNSGWQTEDYTNP